MIKIGVLLIICFNIIGCGGGQPPVHIVKTRKTYIYTTTYGQELMDLKESKDKGLISEQEYINLKKELDVTLGRERTMKETVKFNL